MEGEGNSATRSLESSNVDLQEETKQIAPVILCSCSIPIYNS